MKGLVRDILVYSSGVVMIAALSLAAINGRAIIRGCKGFAGSAVECYSQWRDYPQARANLDSLAVPPEKLSDSVPGFLNSMFRSYADVDSDGDFESFVRVKDEHGRSRRLVVQKNADSSLCFPELSPDAFDPFDKIYVRTKKGYQRISVCYADADSTPGIDCVIIAGRKGTQRPMLLKKTASGYSIEDYTREDGE